MVHCGTEYGQNLSTSHRSLRPKPNQCEQLHVYFEQNMHIANDMIIKKWVKNTDVLPNEVDESNMENLKQNAIQ